MIILINKNDDKWIIEYYTIKLLLNYKIENINKQLKIFLNSILEIYKDRIKIMTLIKNGYEMIEQNVNILKEDLKYCGKASSSIDYFINSNKLLIGNQPI